MKKYIILVFLLTIILSACAKSESGGRDNQLVNGRPDFGQPERPADITGLVKSITWNEATIIKMDRERNQGEEENGNGEARDAGTFASTCDSPRRSITRSCEGEYTVEIGRLPLMSIWNVHATPLVSRLSLLGST